MVAFPSMTVPQLVSRCTRLPVCPVLFTRLTHALQDRTQNICELANIVSMDPALTVKVLRAANGAYYGLSKTVRSVDDAIIRLGFEEIFSITAASRTKELFASTDQWEGFGQNCWSHAVCTAVFARTLARKVLPRQVEDAYYTAALLHDFGKLVFSQIDISYTLLCDYGAIFGDVLVEREMSRYGANHAHLGSELLRQWSLPQLIVNAVEVHHHPVYAGETLEPARMVLIAADFLAHGVRSTGAEGVFNEAPPLPEYLARGLNITPEEQPLVVAEAARQIVMLENI